MSEKIERFHLPDSPADGAGIDIVRVHRSAHRGGDYNLALVGHGFEASRYLTREEAEELRDWFVHALSPAPVQAHTEGEGK